MQLASSRYFLLAERLVHYSGAVRGALLAEHRASAPAASDLAAAGARGAVTAAPIDDMELMAALTEGAPGMPGIEYVNGG